MSRLHNRIVIDKISSIPFLTYVVKFNKWSVFGFPLLQYEIDHVTESVFT